MTDHLNFAKSCKLALKVAFIIILAGMLLWRAPRALLQTQPLAAPPAQSAAASAAPELLPSAKPLRVARRDHTATLLADGRVLVVGGRDNNNTVLRTAELYDPATGEWTPTGTLSQVRQQHTALLLTNGNVLVSGGSDGARSLASVEIFDAKQNRWMAAPLLRTARAQHTATLLADGKVLVTGGLNAQGVTRTSEIFDAVNGATQWTPTDSLLAGRRGHAAVLLPSGQVLVAGGGTLFSTLSSVEVFDPTSGKWRTTGSLRAARRQHTLTVLNTGAVLAAGGSDGNNALDSSETFNTRTQTWTLTANNLSNRRYAHAAVLLPNGKVLVAGGAGDGVLASTEFFDPANGQWAAGEPMNEARADFTATLLANGRVLLAGGGNTSRLALDRVELFEARSDSWTLTRNSSDAQTLMARSRYAHTATLLPDGTVLVVGGHEVAVVSGQIRTGTIETAEIFDPATQTWRNTHSNMNAQRESHTATLLPDGRVLVVGGKREVSLNSYVYSNTAEIYNPVDESWRLVSIPMNGARANHTATLLNDGRVVIAGGYSSSSGALASGQIYNPATTSGSPWSAPLNNLNLLSVGRGDHTATLLPNNTVLFAGGGNQAQVYATADIYDPAVSTRRTVSLQQARTDHTATLLPDGRVLLAGGVGAQYLQSAELFNYRDNSSTLTNTPLSPRARHTATLLNDGKVLLAGGQGSSSALLNSAELFDSLTGAWQAASSLSSTTGRRRSHHAAVLLLDGRVLAVGGLSSLALNNPNSYRDSSELYDAGYGFAESVRPALVNGLWGFGFMRTFLLVDGLRFRGATETAGGGAQSSPSDHPVVQLRSLANDQVIFVPADGWSDTSFSGVPGGLPPGYARLTVFSRGIPSAAHLIRFQGDNTSNNVASIRGRVMDAYGAPFPLTLRVTSSADNLPRTAQTDANGFFIFPNLPASVLDTIGGEVPQRRSITYTLDATPPSGFFFEGLPERFITNPTPSPGSQSNRFLANVTAVGGQQVVLVGRLQCPSGVNTQLTAQATSPGIKADECSACKDEPIPCGGQFRLSLQNTHAWTINVRDANQSYVFAPTGTSCATFDNPTPNRYACNAGQASLQLNFKGELANPVPRLISLTPSRAPVGAGLQLTVAGSDFVTGTRLFWNNSERASNVISSSLLTAEIPAEDLVTPGNVIITVVNPGPGGGTSNPLTFTTLSCATLTVAPATLPTGQAGTTYNQQLTTTGGTPPYQFRVTAGVLPRNVDLSPNGLLEGAPIDFGEFNFTVQTTDASGCTGTRAYSLVINPSCGALTITPAVLTNGLIGAGYSQTLSATGGTAPYTFAVSAGALPIGVSLAATGELSGTPTTEGTFNFTIAVTDANNCTGTRPYVVTVSSNGLMFYPLARPFRLLDTRPDGQRPGPAYAMPGAKLSGDFTQTAHVSFNGITIPAEARAIIGTATVINFPEPGQFQGLSYATIFPADAQRPEVSNLNYVANQTVSNAFTVALSRTGEFKLFSPTEVHMVVDVVGYYAPPAPGGLYYHLLKNPVRLLETRGGGCPVRNAKLPGGGVLTQPARGICEDETIPAAARVLVGNLTAVNADAPDGIATAYAGDLDDKPLINSLAYGLASIPQQAVANNLVVNLDNNGAFKLAVSQTTDLIVDATGYFSPEAQDANGPGLLFTPLSEPVRLLDTRPGLPACYTPHAPLPSERTQTIRACPGLPDKAHLILSIPSAAQAILGNATVVNYQSSGTGHVTLFPGDVPAPRVSNLNYGTQPHIIPNAFIVRVSDAGEFKITALSMIDFLIDVTGYFAP